MKNHIIILSVYILLTACHASVKQEPRDTTITVPSRQESLYRDLNQLLPDSLLYGDSVAVMILPMEASCPSCRDKAIDSIVYFRKKLLPRHEIILSANGGRKMMRSYFKSAGYKSIPNVTRGLHFDSTNMAGRLELYSNNPVFYFLAGGKVYRKIDGWPHTIKGDLQEFFRGYRLNHP